MPLRILWVAARTQLRIARRNIENVYPLLTIPLQSLISLAIIVHSGRPDLAHYSLVASLLMTVGQMSFFDASEILAQDRNQQILELAVASPTAYALPLIARILVLTSMGIAGFAESWLMARFIFGIHVTIFHPGLFIITLIFTVLAGAATIVVSDSNDTDLPECHQWPALSVKRRAGSRIAVACSSSALQPTVISFLVR